MINNDADDPLNTNEVFGEHFLDEEIEAERKAALKRQADEEFDEEQRQKKVSFDKMSGRLLVELYGKLQRLCLIFQKTSVMEQESLGVLWASVGRLAEIAYKKHRITEEVERILARLIQGLDELKSLPAKRYIHADINEADTLGRELSTIPRFIADLMDGMGHKMVETNHYIVAKLHKIAVIAEAKALLLEQISDIIKDTLKKEQQLDGNNFDSKKEE